MNREEPWPAAREFIAEVLRVLDNSLWLSSSPQYKRGEPIHKCTPAAAFARETAVSVRVKELADAEFCLDHDALMEKARAAAANMEGVIRLDGRAIGKTNRQFSGQLGIMFVEIEGWIVAAQWDVIRGRVMVTFPFVHEGPKS